MSDFDPIDPVTARNQLAALHRKPGSHPDPEVDAAARAKLATSKIDKAIRLAMDDCPGPLHPAQVEYLIGRVQQAGAQR